MYLHSMHLCILKVKNLSRDKNRVCPVELAGSLDNKIRKWFQNPQKILAPYIKEGMKYSILDAVPDFFLSS